MPPIQTSWSFRLKAFLAAGLAVLIIGFAFALVKWPFTKAQTIKTLEARSGRKVTIGEFRTSYFPPGMVAGDVRFLRIQHPENEPLIMIHQMTLQASWAKLLTFQQRVSRVDVYGMKLSVPPRGLGADGQHHTLIPLNSSTGSSSGLRFDKVYFHTVLVKFLPGPGGAEPFSIAVKELLLTRLKNNEPFGFEGIVENTVPRGEVREKGEFGPWMADDPSRTPVRGSFSFQNGNLHDLGEISGTLASEGKFEGTLDSIEIDGRARVPDFRVLRSSHVEALESTYRASVNATDGDVQLRSLDTKVGRTTVHTEGRVAGTPGTKGKTATLHAKVTSGRAEDLERIFIAAKIPPLVGGISLDTAIRLSPGPQHFLTRLEMAGTFRTTGEKFTNPSTQSKLNDLVEHPVDSQMTGRVVVKGGTAHISDLLLTCPETAMRMDGTFNLISKHVDMQGTLKTDGKLSDTQSGFKAFAVKLITPFLKKHGSTVVPFEIRGSYGDLQTRMDLDGKRKL